jgi:addiction module RelE/StbE family toxin
MIHVCFHKKFAKEIQKLSKKEQKKFKERYILFSQNRLDPILKDHQLKGDLLGKRSFSITGDIRVIYAFLDSDKTQVMFLRIGTHNQVY